MNRSTVLAVVATAAIGLAGGAVTAVVRGDADRPDTPTASAPPTKGADAVVLYAGDRTIVDGDKRVHWEGAPDSIGQLARVDGGWLVSAPHPETRTEPAMQVFLVTPGGTTKEIADVVGRFEVNAAGDRIVGQATDSGAITVWDLTGKVRATSDQDLNGQATGTWVGDNVLISYTGDAYSADTALFTPAHGTTEDQPMTMRDVVASRDGSLIAGAVGNAVASARENQCTAVRAGPSNEPKPATKGEGFTTCDYRPASTQPFSPSGKRFLAVSVDSDGFGPSELVAFSAAKGPSSGLVRFHTPALTMEGSWLDDDRLVLVGAGDERLDENTEHWVKVCVLRTGTCTEVARAKHVLTAG